MKKGDNRGIRKMSNFLFLVILGGFLHMGCQNINAAETKETKMDHQTWKSRFEERKAAYFALDFSTKKYITTDIKEPRIALAHALVALQKAGGENPEVAEFISQALDPARAKSWKGKPPEVCMFVMTAVVRALIAFPEAFTEEQIEQIERHSRLYPHYTELGTENHRLMRWTSGYYFAQRFGGEWKIGERTVTAGEMMAALKKKMMEEFHFRMDNGGMAEFLSPIYLTHHIYPLMNLFEPCQDTELREAAKAVVMLHLTHLALNVHDGYILEPNSRSGAQQFTGKNLRSANGSQYLSWELWETFKPGPQRLTYHRDVLTIAGSFLCDWEKLPLPPYLDDLANGRSMLPFSSRSVGMKSHFPRLTVNGSFRTPRNPLRSIYRAQRYAIGAGYQQHIPDGFSLQHNLFGITWSSENEAAFLQCGHNYWFADNGQDGVWRSPGSPFQQIAHHENSAIVVFNMPRKDPWAKTGRSDFIVFRDEHANDLIKEAEVRFPAEVKDRVWLEPTDRSGSTLFLNDNGVFIAIRSLTPARQARMGKGFDGIRSKPRKNGKYFQSAFFFHVGTNDEYASFEDFQKQVLAAKIKADWGTGDTPTPRIEVTDPDGDTLAIKYNNNLTPEKNGVIANLPDVTINGKALDYASWPDMEGPGVKLEKGVLTVNGKTYQIPEETSLKATRVLRDAELTVEVMEPNSPERYNQGVRFSPVANVLRAKYKGKDYLFSPVEHNPLKDNGGLAMEFDPRTQPPGFTEAKMNDGFVKIGVGVLKKNREKYHFRFDYDLINRPKTNVEWSDKEAIFNQVCEGVNGYAYKLWAKVSVAVDTITIDYKLTNSGKKPFMTENYAHNFFLFDGQAVGPGYTITFPYGYQATHLEAKKEHEQKGRILHFKKEIPKAVNIRVFPPENYQGANSLTVKQENGMSIKAVTSIPGNYTAVHASKKYLCPEQFVKIELTPGETKEWTRTYKLSL